MIATVSQPVPISCTLRAAPTGACGTGTWGAGTCDSSTGRRSPRWRDPSGKSDEALLTSVSVAPGGGLKANVDAAGMLYEIDVNFRSTAAVVDDRASTRTSSGTPVDASTAITAALTGESFDRGDSTSSYTGWPAT